ncbi:ABC transporter ATP-binding protein [candidate division WOR-3 bacterium]|uniref:ABC transporter ATP-binding protein n=1 Tax=candidate division WOR-3 bacterium TaxID=2052148 RepID=A0A660SEH4_UNCW3|nr:MAG: ABC transporter ATP-binding protein [candidate division WOR-3 bacterium]
MKLVELRNITKTYRIIFGKKVEALRGITLVVGKGEAVALVGPNGAGKTTAIKIILGLLNPDCGKISIFGQDPNSDIRKRIGYLPENPTFYRFLTGRENLLFLTRMVDPDIPIKRIDEMLRLVGLYGAKDRPVRGYSRGMVQRLGIAQAIIHNPDLLILDEPLSGLDPIGRKEIRSILLNMKKEGKTIFFSTHILPDVTPLADRVIVINKGRIVSDLPVAKIGDIEDHLIQILR